MCMYVCECACVSRTIIFLSPPMYRSWLAATAETTFSAVYVNTGCGCESDDFATLFFLVRQQWGGSCYRHFAANFKAF